MGPPYGKRDPYYSHSTPMFESLKIWEACMGPAYHKGVPSLGVPGVTLDISDALSFAED